MKSDYKTQNRQLAVFKTLANANRIKILKAIITSPTNELNVTSLTELLNLSAPKVSDHLKIMRINKIVQARQIGSVMMYSIKDQNIPKLLAIK